MQNGDFRPGGAKMHSMLSSPCAATECRAESGELTLLGKGWDDLPPRDDHEASCGVCADVGYDCVG